MRLTAICSPMSESTSQFRAIATRRQAIGVEIGNLRSQITALETEQGELEIAARVLSRLGLLAEQNGPELPLPPAPPSSTSDQKMTVPEMIIAVIAEWEGIGLDGATNAQIVEALGKRWGVTDPNIIRPTLWRMVKASRLERKGELYTLPIKQSYLDVHGL